MYLLRVRVAVAVVLELDSNICEFLPVAKESITSGVGTLLLEAFLIPGGSLSVPTNARETPFPSPTGTGRTYDVPQDFSDSRAQSGWLRIVG